MPGNQISNNPKPYLHIVGGNLAHTVDESTPGAKLRKYELKDGTKGQKWEITYMNWSGYIQGIKFKDGDYGTACIVDFGDAFISLNTSSRYFSDFASKILGADLTKEVLFHPYDIEDGEKHKTGVSVKVAGEKLRNIFYDFDNKKFLHGFPPVDEALKEKLKKNYWKVYFAEVEAFLTEKLEQLEIPKAQQVAQVMGGEVMDEPLPEETIPSDLPFD